MIHLGGVDFVSSRYRLCDGLSHPQIDCPKVWMALMQLVRRGILDGIANLLSGLGCG